MSQDLTKRLIKNRLQGQDLIMMVNKIIGIREHTIYYSLIFESNTNQCVENINNLDSYNFFIFIQ